MNKKNKIICGILLPLTLITASAVWYASSNEKSKKPNKKVRSLFGSYANMPTVENGEIDATSMLDEHPYRPKARVSNKNSRKSRFADFSDGMKDFSRSAHKRPSTNTVAGPVKPSTATVEGAVPVAEDVAAAAASVAPAATGAPAAEQAAQAPANAVVSQKAQTPVATSAATEAQKPAIVAQTPAQKGINRELMSMIPALNQPKYQQQLKTTDRLLNNLSNSLQRALASASNNKRMQNISKYAKGGAGGTGGRLGGNRRESPISRATQNIINAAGDAIAQNMEENFGKQAGDKVRQATKSYAASVGQIMSSGMSEEERQQALAAAEAAFQQQVRLTQIESMFNQALDEHKAKYMEGLTDKFGEETAALAEPLLNKYKEDILAVAQNPEATVDDLRKIESEFQVSLGNMVQMNHLEDDNVSVALQEVQGNVVQSNLEHLSGQLAEQQKDGNNITMAGSMSEEDLEKFRLELNTNNQNFIAHVLNSEEMAALSAEKREEWKNKAQVIYNKMTEDLVTARKNTPLDQSQQFYTLQEQIISNANQAMQNIALTLTEEEKREQEAIEQQNEAYLNQMKKMYGEEAYSEIRNYFLQLKRGLIDREQYDAQVARIAQENAANYEAYMAEQERKRQQEMQRNIESQMRQYKRDILNSRAVTQFPKTYRNVIARFVSERVNLMKNDLLSLVREKGLSPEELDRKYQDIQKRTQEEIEGFLDVAVSNYNERVKNLENRQVSDGAIQL
ncbi:MAG: hypothetical protein IKL48_00605 [Elusimicrobiaceae bacterium]|nr:hypothetical protein [Elusimicrobiaceae bacterium]